MRGQKCEIRKREWESRKAGEKKGNRSKGRGSAKTVWVVRGEGVSEKREGSEGSRDGHGEKEGKVEKKEERKDRKDG